MTDHPCDSAVHPTLSSATGSRFFCTRLQHFTSQIRPEHTPPSWGPNRQVNTHETFFHTSHLMYIHVLLIVFILLTFQSVSASLDQASHDSSYAQFHPLSSRFSFNRQSLKPLTIPLGGGLLHTSGFFFNASVGNQYFTLQVDTKYSSLIVPSTACDGCRPGDHRYDMSKSSKSEVVTCGDDRCHHSHDPDCSDMQCFNCSPNDRCCVENSQNCAFNVLYGDGSSGNGTLLSDQLEIQHLKAEVLFGSMHEESHNFELPYADGAFGLGLKKGACRPSCFPPLMDQLVAKTGLSNMFTMCVTPYGGTLTLGTADSSLATEKYAYVDVLEKMQDRYFVTAAQPTWKVGSRQLSVPSIQSALWTTGTSSIVIPKSAFLALLQHFADHYCHVPQLCDMDSWFRPQSCAIISDSVVAMMPNITIGLSTRVSITLTAEDYLIPYRIIQGNHTRCVGIAASESLGSSSVGMLIGTSVMRRYAIVHDRSQKRIGVARAVTDKCGPSSGSEDGLPALPGAPDENGMITADTTKAPLPSGNSEGAAFSIAETCRAETTCGGCKTLGTNCSFGYETGRCVPLNEASSPSCSGRSCVCAIVGSSGWYLGIFIGIVITSIVIGSIAFLRRKFRRRNRYAMVDNFEEHDLETF